MKKFLYAIFIMTISVFAVGCSNTDIAEETTEELVPFGSFSATTTTGEEVTEAIFADYDITMVKIWATWCSACVSEMDELQEVYAGLDENVNMISICYDGGTEKDLANEILNANGAEFLALIPDSGIITNVISSLQYFPTTIFVDRDGNIVGNKLEGAPSANIVAVYNAYIEGALATVDAE